MQCTDIKHIMLELVVAVSLLSGKDKTQHYKRHTLQLQELLQNSKNSS